MDTCRECLNTRWGPGNLACVVCDREHFCGVCVFRHMQREHPARFIVEVTTWVGRRALIIATLWRVWVTL